MSCSKVYECNFGTLPPGVRAVYAETRTVIKHGYKNSDELKPWIGDRTSLSFKVGLKSIPRVFVNLTKDTTRAGTRLREGTTISTQH